MRLGRYNSYEDEDGGLQMEFVEFIPLDELEIMDLTGMTSFERLVVAELDEIRTLLKKKTSKVSSRKKKDE